MKAYLRQSLLVLSLASASGLAQAELSQYGPALTVLWPQSEQTREAYLEIKSTGIAESVIRLVGQRMTWKAPVTLVLGGRGVPRTEQESQLVVVPYDHLATIYHDLDSSGLEPAARQQVALDAFSYTLVHELAHVAIEQQGESGQWLGEDAVADLTMLTLIEHMPGGDRIARNALRLFDKEAIGMVRPKYNYWSTHALNAERYWSGVCHLLGSGYLFDEVLPAGEMSNAECNEHYATLRNSWGQMFAEDLLPLAHDRAVASR